MGRRRCVCPRFEHPQPGRALSLEGAGSGDPSQRNWLREALVASWRNPRVRGRILVLHHPPYASETSKWREPQTLAVRRQLRGVLDQVAAEVGDPTPQRPLLNLVLTGHAHCLELMRSGATGHGDSHIPWLICGGSGYSLRRQRPQGGTLLEGPPGQERTVAHSELFVGRTGHGGDLAAALHGPSGRCGGGSSPEAHASAPRDRKGVGALAQGAAGADQPVEMIQPQPAPVSLAIALLTVSDRRSADPSSGDPSGDALLQRLEAAGHRLAERQLVPDNRYAIRAALSTWIADPAVQVVITSGGTGLTGRDGTPEAVAPLLDKTIEGFGELFRVLSFEAIGTSTLQSRCLAGVANGTILFVLPGSLDAVSTAWDRLIHAQLDSGTRPCNLVQLLPRLNEDPRQPATNPG